MLPIVVVFDYDATLYNNGKLIFPEETKACLQELHRLGVQIKIATNGQLKDRKDHEKFSTLQQAICKDFDGLLGTDRDFLKEKDIYTFKTAEERRDEWVELSSAEEIKEIVDHFIGTITSDEEEEKAKAKRQEMNDDKEYAKTIPIEIPAGKLAKKNSLLYLIKSDIKKTNGIELDNRKIIFADDKPGARETAEKAGFHVIKFPLNQKRDEPETAQFLRDITELVRNFVKTTQQLYSQQELDYIKCVSIKKPDFITSFEVFNDNQQLKNKIIEFNTSKEGLLRKIQNEQSKTAIIIDIHKFFNKNRQLLIEIEKLSLQLKLAKKNEPVPKQLEQISSQSRALLKHARKFSAWAESIIAKTSFEELPSEISKEPSTAKTYDELGKLDNKLIQRSNITLDRHNQLFQKGIELPPRLNGERGDPQHRAWGTTFRETANRLQPIYDSWAQQPKKQEDLPVEIEFDAEKKEKTAIYNKYFIKEEASTYIATTNSNKELCFSDENPISTDNSDGSKQYIYVMDMDGNLFIHEDGLYIDSQNCVFPNNENNNPDLKRIGHSAFTRGEAVACAGNIKVENGKITFISNDSGHYQPGPYTLHRVVKELKKRGVLDDKCIVQESSGEFGLVNSSGIKESRMNFEEFKTQYENNTAKKDNVEKEVSGDKLDLSEKPNPNKLLTHLSEINSYLNNRSKKTSSIKTRLFNSYTGEDYYNRRSSFKSILEKLSEGNIENAIGLIDIEINNKKLHKRFAKTRTYESHLNELKTILKEYEKHKTNVLQIDYVNQKIKSYWNIYDKMDNYTESVKNYVNNYQFFSNEKTSDNKDRSAIAAAKLDYKYLHQAMPKNIKDEFSKDKDLHEIEYNNRTSFKRGGR